MFRMLENMYYSGEYYEYIKYELEKWDVTQDYYEDDIVIYKNKTYKANKDTDNNNYTEFVTDDWDKITKSEGYYNDVPQYFRYKKLNTTKVRQEVIKGLDGLTVTATIETTSDINFKIEDKILLQDETNQLKIVNITPVEGDQNINNLAFFQFANTNAYLNKVISLQ